MAVRALITSVPDTALNSLNYALGQSGDTLFQVISELVIEEIRYRKIRDLVFEAFVPLFSARDDGIPSVVFSKVAYRELWTALLVQEPELCQEALLNLNLESERRPEDAVPTVFYRLVTASARLTRDVPDQVFVRSGLTREQTAELAAYLDLNRIARRALGRMPDWLGRIDAERSAALRVLFKDACDLHPSSGKRLLELMFCHLKDPLQIMKLVVTVSDRASERFLIDSELADFGTRLLDYCEASLKPLEKRDSELHKGDTRKACEQITRMSGLLSGFDQYVELSKDGPWGKAVGDMRKRLSGLVEGRLKGVESAIHAALPTTSTRLTAKVRKSVPKINGLPDPEKQISALSMAAFLKETRSLAANNGFGSLHSSIHREQKEWLREYADELVSHINSGDIKDEEAGKAHLEVAADILDAMDETTEAALVRRRAAAAGTRNGADLA